MRGRIEGGIVESSVRELSCVRVGWRSVGTDLQGILILPFAFGKGLGDRALGTLGTPGDWLLEANVNLERLEGGVVSGCVGLAL